MTSDGRGEMANRTRPPRPRDCIALRLGAGIAFATLSLLVTFSLAQRQTDERLTWTLLICLASSIALNAIAIRRARTRLRDIVETLSCVADGELDRRPTIAPNDGADPLDVEADRAFARLQESVESLQQLSSAVAHELRAPLARLLPPVDRALEEAQAGRPDVGSILESRKRVFEMLGTFDALLRISRVQSGQRRRAFGAVDLVEIVDDVHEIYEPVCEAAGLSLEPTNPSVPTGALVPDVGRIAVMGDRELLRQALINLVENAIRHCPSGTSVRMCACRVGGVPAITVTDDGPGIAEVERPKVFRRLYRTGGGAPGRPGSGLGLALVRAIAELHDAEASLHDAAPGLEARIRFPGGGGGASRRSNAIVAAAPRRSARRSRPSFGSIARRAIRARSRS